MAVLSEEAKLNQIIERIREVARNERNGLLIIVMGVFFVGAGLIFSVVWNSSVGYILGIFVVALGVFSTLFGFYLSVHYAHQYNTLLRELDTIA